MKELSAGCTALPDALAGRFLRGRQRRWQRLATPQLKRRQSQRVAIKYQEYLFRDLVKKQPSARSWEYGIGICLYKKNGSSQTCHQMVNTREHASLLEKK